MPVAACQSHADIEAATAWALKQRKRQLIVMRQQELYEPGVISICLACILALIDYQQTVQLDLSIVDFRSWYRKLNFPEKIWMMNFVDSNWRESLQRESRSSDQMVPFW